MTEVSRCQCGRRTASNERPSGQKVSFFVFFLSGCSKAEQTELQLPLHAYIAIVVESTSGEGEQNDRVCDIADAPGSFLI